MRPVLKSPLLQEEAAAVMTTRLMMLAAAGTPQLVEYEHERAHARGSSSVQGTSDMMTSSAPR